MLEKRIYDYDSEYPRTIIISHGGSENMIVYDSEGLLTDWSEKKKEKLEPDPYEKLEREILGE